MSHPCDSGMLKSEEQQYWNKLSGIQVLTLSITQWPSIPIEIWGLFCTKDNYRNNTQTQPNLNVDWLKHHSKGLVKKEACPFLDMNTIYIRVHCSFALQVVTPFLNNNKNLNKLKTKTFFHASENWGHRGILSQNWKRQVHTESQYLLTWSKSRWSQHLVVNP